MKLNLIKYGLILLYIINEVKSLKSSAEYFSNKNRPLILAHRGASGYFPEHTLQGYSTAFYMQADFIEPDIVFTQDNVLVCLHDAQLSLITDVAERIEFKDRKRKFNYDGKNQNDWWSFDFTLQEIKTLRIKQRYQMRNQYMNGLFQIQTLEEVIKMMLDLNSLKIKDKPTGLYIEQKCPSCFTQMGYFPETSLYQILSKYNLTSVQNCQDTLPIILQNFELQYLKYFNSFTDLPLIKLYESKSDFLDLQEVEKYTHGIGPNILSIFTSFNPLVKTDLIQRAKQLDLKVHVYTIRDDMLPNGIKSNDLYNLLHLNEIDGVFTEFVDKAENAYLQFDQNNMFKNDNFLTE